MTGFLYEDYDNFRHLESKKLSLESIFMWQPISPTFEFSLKEKALEKKPLDIQTIV